MSTITIKQVTKAFGDVVVLKEFNEVFQDKEFITLLGPSGCGKTTMLRMIAGFEKPTSGEISIDGRVVSSEKTFVPPEKRDIGMVFQSYAVWPHMTVFDNVAYPLKIKKLDKATIKQKVDWILEAVHLSQYAQRIPSQLSGGQQQRVALGRALVAEPKLLLLDEPLSNLDAKLRESMRFEIKEIQKNFGISVVYVTHDQSEAMAISDRMMVCDMGKIMQIDTPENLYNKPNSRFVHSFLGESTFINVVIQDGKVFAAGDTQHPLDLEIPKDAGRNMVVATRPNSIDLLKPGEGPGYPTRIDKRIFLTDRTEYLVQVGDQTLKIQVPHRISFAEGDACHVRFVSPMWYPAEDEAAEKERQRRQLV